jgi:hypothetical protein
MTKIQIHKLEGSAIELIPSNVIPAKAGIQSRQVLVVETLNLRFISYLMLVIYFHETKHMIRNRSNFVI